MLADGAGTEKCHHFMKSIPSFALKKKEERKKAAGRKRRKKEILLSIHIKSILSCLSCTTTCKHIDSMVTFFLKRCLYHTISNENSRCEQKRLHGP